jgi:hypothetical protein
MKKIAMLLSVFASVLILSSCATKTQPPASVDTTVHTSHHHHDYKGER